MANTWVNREDSFLSLKFSVNDSGGSRAALVTGMGSAEMKRRPVSSGATSLEEGDWGAGS